MKIVPLFPNCLGKISNFISDEERLKILWDVKTIKHQPHGSIIGNGASSHKNRNIDFPYIVDNNIKNRLETEINIFGELYGIPTDLKISQIWSNIQNSDSVLHEHSHPNSIISGALYINVDDSCSITFHNPNPYVYFTNALENTPYNFEWCKYSVENGDLLLFPSWLRHGHPEHINQMDGRICISFNSEY